MAEDILWEFLRAQRLGFKFRREHPITDRYRLDFYCPEALLAVELDGEQHNATRDARRDEDMALLGILTYRIPNRHFFQLEESAYVDYVNEIQKLCEQRTGRAAFK